MNDKTLYEISSELSQIIGYVELLGFESGRPAALCEDIKNSVYRIDALMGEPQKRATDHALNSYAKEKTIAVKKILDSKNVLIVDDVVDNQRTLKNIFSIFKCNIECVSDGDGALKSYESFKPDIVFMDIVMPGMDGDEVTKLLKEKGCDAIFIAVSALKEYSKKNISIFDSWLPKPFTVDQILDAIAGCYFCDLEYKHDYAFVEKTYFNDLSETEKIEIIKSIEHGAISELEQEIDGLEDSKCKKWLQTKLSQMNLDAILANLNRRKLPR